MRRVSTDSAQPGMFLGKTIIGGAGQVLLKSGVEIKPQYLIYLERLGINYIYVQDSRMQDVEINDIIREEVRQEARSLVRDVIKKVPSPSNQKKGLNIKDKKVLKTVSSIIEDLLEDDDTISQLMDIRSLDDYLFSHSVNSCILATLVGKKLNYNINTLKQLAMGTLLHDMGMVAVPEKILKKPGELTEDEYATVKNPPHYGYEIFKSSKLFSAQAGAVILRHHERYHGQGYPQGLKSNENSALAQIAGIADVYDALTSERSYRKAFQPYQAIEMLMAWGEDYFDMEILNHFLSITAAYPIGFHVFLSNGESGLVIANNQGLTLRPVVRVLYTGEDLAPHPSPYDLDLSQVLDITIVKVLD